jgi:hypothetical protein
VTPYKPSKKEWDAAFAFDATPADMTFQEKADALSEYFGYSEDEAKAILRDMGEDE